MDDTSPPYDLAPLYWSTNWRRCLADFLRYHDNRSTNTYRSYRSTLTRFFTNPAKHSPEQYTRTDVEAFIYVPTPTGGKPTVGTTNCKLAAISAFYAYAAAFLVVESDYTPRPLLQVPSPTTGMEYGRPAKVHRAFSTDEIKRFFAAIPLDTVYGSLYRALFWTYLITGRRREELLRLKWGDLSYETLADEYGQQHEGWSYRYFSKGKREEESRAELPISAKHLIDRYLELSGRREKIQPGDPLFISPRAVKIRPIDGETVARAVKHYCHLAGLDADRLCIHSFRHTMVQQRLELGQSMLDIMKITGHQSLDSFFHYTQRLTSVADDGAKKVESRFSDLLG